MTTLLGDKKADLAGPIIGSHAKFEKRPNLPITLLIACLLVAAAPPQIALAQCEREWAKGFGLAGLDGWPYAMTVFNDGWGDALYIGGAFPVAGDALTSNIVKWDGATWSPLGSGIGGPCRPYVSALTVFDDGSGPALYAGGRFSMAGDVHVNRIAKWDGTSWSALGAGIGDDWAPEQANECDPYYVTALTVFDDGSGPALYAGGVFATAGGVPASHIAKWDGMTWSAVGSGTNGVVSALTVFDDGGGPALYAGGKFSMAGGVPANGIAKWNGSIWSGLGTGLSGGAVGALSVFDDGSGPALYAGGLFTSAGGVSANRIAKWNGSNWSPLGAGLDLDPYAWDDSFDAYVNAIGVFDDGGGPALYAGGWFTTAGNVSAQSIAKWNGSSWSALETGMDEGVVFILAAFDDGSGAALFAGGDLYYAGGVPVNKIAKWDGGSWSALGSETDASIRALAVFDDGTGEALYAGGSFTTFGGIPANYVAKRNGTTWSALGSGVGGADHPFVSALAVFDDGGGPALYAAGKFTTAGGVGAKNIAKWNGTSWSALGTGLGEYAHHYVSTLAVFDDGGGQALYAGGETRLGNVAKWNGKTWSGEAGNIYWSPTVLAVFDDGSGPALYAGGDFSPPGDGPKTIAKWDGTSWSPLGSGLTEGNGSPMSTSVRALTVFDDGGELALYVGGRFRKAGGVWVNNIAKWDGTGWSALGTGMDPYASVLALTVFDDGGGPALYAGGLFDTTGGVSARRIAKWDGSSWSALGTGIAGLNAYVLALTGFDDGAGPTLYAGGQFSTAGGKVSANFAKWACVRRGDMNQDSLVDLGDFATFFDCFAGPSQTLSDPACGPGDVDWNEHIDLLDFATLQHTFGQ